VDHLLTSALQQLYFAARPFIFLALGLSKLSLLVFTRRIFQGDFHGE
jgi:hypothetical protein